jgi:hypothetical protein
LLPPWDGSEIVWKKGSLAPGGKVLMKLRHGPFSLSWEAHHVEEIPGVMFRDIQHRGPFAHFSHHVWTDGLGNIIVRQSGISRKTHRFRV